MSGPKDSATSLTKLTIVVFCCDQVPKDGKPCKSYEELGCPNVNCYDCRSSSPNIGSPSCCTFVSIRRFCSSSATTRHGHKKDPNDCDVCPCNPPPGVDHFTVSSFAGFLLTILLLGSSLSGVFVFSLIWSVNMLFLWRCSVCDISNRTSNQEVT